MTRAQVVFADQCDMISMGGCPTVEPPAELAAAWREVVLRIMAGDATAIEQAAQMREMEIGAFVMDNPEAGGALEALYATQTA
jgi:hypothetical protein